MEKFVIGDEGSASVREVAEIIEKSNSFGQLVKNWTIFAENLDVKDEDRLELERKINFGVVQLKSAPREVLKIWAATKSKHATLKVLYDALKDSGVLAIADILEAKCLQPGGILAEKQNEIFCSIVVGEAGCKNLDIANILADDSCASGNWKTLAAALETKPGKLMSVTKQLNTGVDFTTTDLFIELLAEWKARNGKSASTLFHLFEAFKSAGANFNDVTERIREKCAPSPKAN